MNKETKQKILAGVLILIGAVIAWDRFNGGQAETEDIIPEEVMDGRPTESIDTPIDPNNIKRTLIKVVKIQRNPFGEKFLGMEVGNGKNIKPIDIKLSMILYDRKGGGSMAVINGKEFKEGDFIGRYKLIEINKSNIKISLPGKVLKAYYLFSN